MDDSWTVDRGQMLLAKLWERMSGEMMTGNKTGERKRERDTERD
jgi:hypothetical protein